MENELTKEQIEFYRRNGFIVIEDFLSTEELDKWSSVVMEAVKDEMELKCL